MKIKYSVSIQSKATLTELPEAWTKQDFRAILDELGFSEEIVDSDLIDMTFMAIADQKPEESAKVLLKYRLSEQLNDGQIEQLSHEMQEDKISEEYPDIFLQKELFNVNQLLFKAFNGSFPNAKAIKLTMNLHLEPVELMEEENLVNELILHSLVPALGDHAAISRLYGEELKGEKRFTDADGIIWKKSIEKQADGSFVIHLFSSEFWLHDLPSQATYEGTFHIKPIEEEL